VSETSGNERPRASEQSAPTRRVLEAIRAAFGTDGEELIAKLKYSELEDAWVFFVKETKVTITHEGRMTFKQE
jgi:hypothetical protein